MISELNKYWELHYKMLREEVLTQEEENFVKWFRNYLIEKSQSKSEEV